MKTLDKMRKEGRLEIQIKILVYIHLLKKMYLEIHIIHSRLAQAVTALFIYIIFYQSRAAILFWVVCPTTYDNYLRGAWWTPNNVTNFLGLRWSTSKT